MGHVHTDRRIISFESHIAQSSQVQGAGWIQAIIRCVDIVGYIIDCILLKPYLYSASRIIPIISCNLHCRPDSRKIIRHSVCLCAILLRSQHHNHLFPLQISVELIYISLCIPVHQIRPHKPVLLSARGLGPGVLKIRCVRTLSSHIICIVLVEIDPFSRILGSHHACKFHLTALRHGKLRDKRGVCVFSIPLDLYDLGRGLTLHGFPLPDIHRGQ